MGSLKSLAQGFLVAAGLVWLFNIVSLFRGGDAWLALLYLLILLIPASSITYLKLKNTNQRTAHDASRNGGICCFLFKALRWLSGCLILQRLSMPLTLQV